MSLYDMPNGIKYWRELLANANWSKCVYTYGEGPSHSALPGNNCIGVALACCLYREGGSQNIAEAKKLFSEVPGLMQRIAGRSIPLEVSCHPPAHTARVQCTGHLYALLDVLKSFLRNTPPVKHGSSRRRGIACCYRSLKWHTTFSASQGLQNTSLSRRCYRTLRLPLRLYVG